MILPILKPEDACSYHRLYLPFFYGDMWRPEFETEQFDTLLSKASVVVFNRYWGDNIIHLLKAKKKYGFKIICDVDDYWELYPNHIAYKEWNKTNMAQMIKESMMNADCVTVTTSRLAKLVKPFNKNVEVLPNALPFDKGQFTTKKSFGHETRFIYAGGSTHLYDIKLLEQPIRKISERQRLNLILAGVGTSPIWKKMQKILSNHDKLQGFETRAKQPLDSYMNLYDEADVSLAPLETNYFNRFKSELKILEAGCKNMPIICSNTPPYSDFLGIQGVVKCETTKEWYDALLFYNRHPEYANEVGHILGENVRHFYDLNKINEKRKQLYEYYSK